MLDPKQAREDAQWAREHVAFGVQAIKAVAEFGTEEAAHHAARGQEHVVRITRLAAYADGYARLREEAAPLLTRINAQLHTLVSFLQVYDSCGALDSNRKVREAGNGIQESIHKLTALLTEGQPDEGGAR